jgi:tRNA(Ile)-lysidine synthase
VLTGGTASPFLTELLAPAEAASGVLVAVSGGPDSMALLELAMRWRDEAPNRPPVFAATVDHALRADSHDEALVVAAFALSRGAPHSLLRWDGEKPSTRLQEKAREARYGLLVAEARRLGADLILTGHHADDQAETILMRILRGSAIAGLAGMAAVSPRDGLRLFRPLLGVRKADLVAFCERERIPFVRDPSNESPRFGRTGARRLAAMLEAEGLGPSEWGRLARRAARAEAALAATAQAALAALPTADLPMEALARLPDEIALRCLAARARVAGGADTLRLDRLEAAWERLADAWRKKITLALTLGGARIKLDSHGILTFAAEPPRRRGRFSPQSAQFVHATGEDSCAPGGEHANVSEASLGKRSPRA